MKVQDTNAAQEALYNDLCAALQKHPKLPVQEMLAITANLVGKLIANLDQRRVTPDMAMELVMHNIERGNQQCLDFLAILDSRPTGSA